MPRIIGEGPHETYYHTPDGNWTHLDANGKSWKTFTKSDIYRLSRKRPIRIW